MKKRMLLTSASGVFALVVVSAACAHGDGTSSCGLSDLQSNFSAPPASAKPHTWWHWMNGNVSKEGITADLESIAEAGLGGVQLFDAGCEIPPGPVAFNTPAWDEHVKFAAAEARRLGLEIVVPNCSGWSSSGGPWIAASNAMKVVVTSETSVKAGESFRGKLPEAKNTNGFYRDIAVLAIPDVGTRAELLKEGESKALDPKDATRNVLSFGLPQPFEATALEIALKPSAWIGQHRAFVTVETSPDGAAWTKADEIVVPMAIDSIIVSGVQRIPFAKPIASAHWRLTIAPQRMPGNMKEVALNDLALLNRAVIPGFEGKTFVLRDETPYPTNPSIGPAVPKDAAVDLTAKMAADGEIAWTAPAGATGWKILRIGYACNGKKNHPASRFGCGYEVDKLSKTALAFHFESYIGKLCRTLGDLAGDHASGLVGTLVDSYEIGCQNWTEGLAESFKARAGYDLTPFLPVLCGYVIGTAEETEKFLDDFRRVIASLFCENYPGALQENCRKYGLKFSLEPYGNAPVDNFDYGYFCDIPMSEFWVGEKNNRGTGVSPHVSSMAHVYGKPICGAEAFTAAPGATGGRWLSDPWSLKTQGDIAFCDGVNRLIFHRFAHQPWGKDQSYLPGMTMGKWGTHFDRTNTWWPYAKPFFTYLSRCQYLLQEGRPVADAAVFLGEKMPQTVVPYDVKYLPEGWKYDVVNARGAALITGKDHPLLFLRDTLKRPESLAAVEKAKAAGVKVAMLADAAKLLPPPDFTCAGTTDLVSFIHRAYADGAEGYFVAYANREVPAKLELSFRVTGSTPEFWHPDTGLIERPAKWREAEGRTLVTWQAVPGDSVFVMFAPKGKEQASKNERVEADDLSRAEEVDLEGEWELALPGGKRKAIGEFVSWTQLDDPDFKYFSGTATYRLSEGSVKITGYADRVWLDLGNVRNLAEVKVNGKRFPILWKPPFRVDVTKALSFEMAMQSTEPGAVVEQTASLDVEIKVTNLWPNRLIGDDFKAEDCEWKGARGGIVEIPEWVKKGEKSPTGRTTFTTWKHWTKDDKLLDSGILGPVSVRVLAAEE